MIQITERDYNSRDIIQNIFSPLVGVLCSEAAEHVCLQNNLSFVELLQPFAKLSNDAHFRDVSGTSVSIRGLRLNFCDVNWRPPQTVLARKLLNESVTNAPKEKKKFVKMGSRDLEIPSTQPWFEKWRETFFSVQYPAVHDFTRNFLSCLIVLSTNDRNILETAQKLTRRVHQMQSTVTQTHPKWFHPNMVLNNYVVLHEGSRSDLSRIQHEYEKLKSAFGDNKCFLIQVNSSSNPLVKEVPDHWTTYIQRQTRDISAESINSQKPTDSASGMPSNVLTESSESANSMLHPLSPVQDDTLETISAQFSISSESVAGSSMNTGATETECGGEVSYGNGLNSMDVENLRHFVQDYAVRALIPYVEQLVTIFNEALANKKGVSKSLLSVTKRWFVPNKPVVGASTQNAIVYTYESVELLTRKLGDLYFLFGNYSLAFQAYHQSKRDFSADSAWQYYAGALEMAAVSAFMSGTSSRKTYDYMEDAILCFLNVCKLQQFATRATLLSMICLRSAGLHSEVAKQLIRMTSEESDLRSALLLEQAGYCFLDLESAMYRKYAFHVVLSGNRFSRAGQRKHSYRCYRQAFEVFQRLGWSLAEDHIQYTLAKQAFLLKKLEEASFSLASLLRQGSLQSKQQQAVFIREYIQTHNELIKRKCNQGILTLALPQVRQETIRVLLLPLPTPKSHLVPANHIDIQSDTSEETNWHKIEETLVATAIGKKTFVFKPVSSLYSKENPTTEFPIAVQGEPIALAVTLSNFMKCSLALSNVNILWRLKLENDEELSSVLLYENEIQIADSVSDKTAVKAAVKTSCIDLTTLEENAEKTLIFTLTPKLAGHLNIMGIVANVSPGLDANNSLFGSLIFERSERKTQGKLCTDNKLSIKIIPSIPALIVSFTAVPTDVVAGEIMAVTISLRNAGICAIENILIGSDSPRWVSFKDERDISLCTSNETEEALKNKAQRSVFRLLENAGKMRLDAQESITVPMWIQAPYTKGKFSLRLLVYYSLPASHNTNIKYRLVRHTWDFNVFQSLQMESTCVVASKVSNELSLKITAKHEREVSSPISDFAIDGLHLNCPVYKLSPKKCYNINKEEIMVGANGEYHLKPSQTLSLQCYLLRSDLKSGQARSGGTELLSSMNFTTAPAGSSVPQLSKSYSFLAKHKNALSVSNTSLKVDSHLIVALQWTTTMTHGAAKRNATGQHFVELQNLYEKNACPATATVQNELTAGSNTSHNILNFTYKNDTKQQLSNFSCSNDLWDGNKLPMSRRCLIHNESFLVGLKS